MLTNDRSFRIALWIIALSLAIIALKPMVRVNSAYAGSGWENLFSVGQEKKENSSATSSDQAAPTSAQLGGTAQSGRIVPFASQGGGVFWAYDRDTLAIYVYDSRNGKGYYLGKLSQLGKSMDRTGVTSSPFLRD